MAYFLDWSQKKCKSPFFSGWPCITLQAPFQGHICWSDVPKTFCLQHPGIVANWIDFKPPFQNKVHSSPGYVFFCSHLPNIYTKWINPKFATQSKCNHIYVSFSMGMLFSDIWSRCNFWVVHTSWVLMSVKLLIKHLQTESVTFVANVGFICLICLSDSDDVCGPKWHLKCPRNFRLSPWILPIKPFLDCP